MSILSHKKGALAVILIALLTVMFVAIEAAWVICSGRAVPRPVITREPQVLGSGPSLTYVILGDSTAVAQGGDYTKGYAVATAQHLADTHRVTWVNLAVSGSRAADVATRQVTQAAGYKPDVVLVAVGANDVTHLTSLASVQHSLAAVIATLRQANAHVKIILTGSPDMGSVPRFPQPLRWLAGQRTTQLNQMITELATAQGVTFAPIARETGPAFRQHHELFAPDNFHPTTEGYALWVPVLTAAIDRALGEQPER